MTNERAIELLNRISDSQFDGPHGDERREALSMAVRALEQNLVQEPDGLVKDLVKDCISRQQAIDAVSEGCQEWRGIFERCKEKLLALPSAQFATDINVGDNISRQVAIDGIKKEILKGDRQSYKGLLVANHVIVQLPPAQAERKKGRWIDYTDEGYVECPFCHSATNCDGNKDELHFCFSCGADMRGE